MVRHRGSREPEGSCDSGGPAQNGPAELGGAGAKCGLTHGNPSTKELRQKGGVFKASLNYTARTSSQNSINLGLGQRGLRQLVLTTQAPGPGLSPSVTSADGTGLCVLPELRT